MSRLCNWLHQHTWWAEYFGAEFAVGVQELEDLERKVRRPAGTKPPPLPTLPKKQLGGAKEADSKRSGKPGRGRAAQEELPGFIADDDDEAMELQDSGALQLLQSVADCCHDHATSLQLPDSALSCSLSFYRHVWHEATSSVASSPDMPCMQLVLCAVGLR